MGGIEALKMIRLEDPLIKIILSLGYSDPHLLEIQEPIEYDAFLVKPYSKQDLLEVLHKTLKRSSVE